MVTASKPGLSTASGPQATAVRSPGQRINSSLYPDLGYVLVVLGNTDSDGTQTIATHARDVIAASLRR